MARWPPWRWLPLALLPTAWGGLLWIWLNLAVFFAALRALMKRILPGPWTPHREGLFLCLVLVGITRSIWSGQSNLLVFGLVALGAVAIADRRWWLAACLLAIPVHIKVWPLAVALLLVACWPRRLAARLAVCVLAIGALPFLTKPFPWVCRQYDGWFAMLVGPAQTSPFLSRRLDPLGDDPSAGPADDLPGVATGRGGGGAGAVPLAGPEAGDWLIFWPGHRPQVGRGRKMCRVPFGCPWAPGRRGPAAVVRAGGLVLLANGVRPGHGGQHLRPDRAVVGLGVVDLPGGEAGADRDGCGLRPHGGGQFQRDRSVAAAHVPLD